MGGVLKRTRVVAGDSEERRYWNDNLEKSFPFFQSKMICGVGQVFFQRSFKGS